MVQIGRCKGYRLFEALLSMHVCMYISISISISGKGLAESIVDYMGSYHGCTSSLQNLSR